MTPDSPQSFDPFSAQYNERLSECLHNYGGRDAIYYNRLKADIILRLAGRRFGRLDSLKFLDIGCGIGMTENAIGNHFGTGVGLDLSMGMLKARQCKNQNCFFLRSDAAALPFPDRSFDILFSVTLLHHLPDQALSAVFREARRVLKKGGLMIHFDHNPLNFLTRKIVNECEFDRGTTLRKLNQIKELALRNGFSVSAKGYLIFIPKILKFLEPLEKILNPVPLGGQYYLAATAD